MGREGMSENRVYIAGAGPVGLITALLLCRQGIPVTMLEAEPWVCQDTRAVYYHAPSLDMLEEIGFLEPLVRGGELVHTTRYVDVALGRETSLDFSILSRRYRNPYSLCVAQSWFCKIGAELLNEHDCEIMFNHRVVDARQDDTGVDVTIESPDGRSQVRSEWLIACDGASSIIRKSQGIAFEGYTWPDRFLLIETPHDFQPEFGTVCYFLNGLDWRLVTKICFGPGENDWVYRVVSGVQPEDVESEILDPANLQAIIQRTRPQDEPYAIERASIYSVHQRVAETFRKGRIILAGDSAHLNNPMGGQGLNCGIHDAFNLAEKFVDVWKGGSPDVLDLYDRQRRITNTEYIQKVSVENKKRNEQTDLVVRAAAFDTLEAILANEDSRFAFIDRFCMGESLDFAKSIT
jgi:3-(3-hydroxy-phenyl)propionate hydroxylase